jgi:peptidoglycan-N-acetylglucosamine deacetylase
LALAGGRRTAGKLPRRSYRNIPSVSSLGLAKQLLGRSPKHVMLLHTNAINAASVGAIITAFRARGWQFVSPTLAFGDPMYTLQPSNVPAGESIVWALAKERGISGLRYPGEDSVYEEPKLRALGLLP